MGSSTSTLPLGHMYLNHFPLMEMSTLHHFGLILTPETVQISITLFTIENLKGVIPIVIALLRPLARWWSHPLIVKLSAGVIKCHFRVLGHLLSLGEKLGTIMMFVRRYVLYITNKYTLYI